MTYIYPILIIFQSYSGEGGGVTSYNSLIEDMDDLIKRLRTYGVHRTFFLNCHLSMLRSNVRDWVNIIYNIRFMNIYIYI